jgi:transposase
MFIRVKKTGKYRYLQIVHNERVNGRVEQRVIATLGNLNTLEKTGQIDAVITSLGKYSQHTAVLDARRKGKISQADTIKIGPVLVFEKLWWQSGFPDIFKKLLSGRHFEFPVERAIFITVLHRLFSPGSDRAAEVWCRKYAIEGSDKVALHHFYRPMAWLGEELPADQQYGATPFSPRRVKDLIEEMLFEHRRILFTELDIVFFDTTSIYFEGKGGQNIGELGHSKDNRPDLKQMIVGAVLDNEGHPICCELWPGNTTDVKTLIPVVRRLKKRFHIGSICIVGDRGMISKATISELKKNDIDARYILGTRMRSFKEVKHDVLSRAGRYHEVYGARGNSRDPSPLQVKEVQVNKRRYIVCHNEEQARKDRLDREAIIAGLKEQLKCGAKSLVGNKGYRKYLKSNKGNTFEIDENKICDESRYDGKWVLQTDMNLSPAEVALKYKQLWMVEAIFRSMKSVLETRPVFHRWDETICGHVFCSFLALVLLKDLFEKIEQRGWNDVEWDRLKDDLDDLEEITVKNSGKTFVIRNETKGAAGKAIQAAGIALGPAVRLKN